ncbi:hypothetical protein T484DRAFT_1850773 [Baffinella frigidus]|nr:hypothetical protein T484DRAFT_1850773 [Cryptophyta sp. CCMP2293]
MKTTRGSSPREWAARGGGGFRPRAIPRRALIVGSLVGTADEDASAQASLLSLARSGSVVGTAEEDASAQASLLSLSRASWAPGTCTGDVPRYTTLDTTLAVSTIFAVDALEDAAAQASLLSLSRDASGQASLLSLARVLQYTGGGDDGGKVRAALTAATTAARCGRRAPIIDFSGGGASLATHTTSAHTAHTVSGTQVS